MPTPSGRQTNWNPVTWNAGTSFPMVTVTGIRIARRGQTITGRGDANVYPMLKRLISSDPQMTVNCQDTRGPYQTNGPALGSVGSLAATHLDAENQAGGTGTGSLTYTLSNAVVADINSGGEHIQLGTIDYTFEAKSTDGVTSPLAVTIN